MVYFPKEIMTLIYEFDNTCKENYKDVVIQLKKLFSMYHLYIHNYMFHNDLNMCVGIKTRSMAFHAKLVK